MRGLEHGTATLSMDTGDTQKIYFPRSPVSLGTRLRGLFGLWHLWHQRWQQRRQLAELDAHLLRDIGVSPRGAFREASKPFWRA